MQSGLKKALSLARKTFSNTPAYRIFLRKHNINTLGIKTPAHFTKLPIMDKHNYISRYNLPDLFPHRKIPAFAYASSGSSGKPTFWFRGDAQEEYAGKMHAKIFEEVLGINKKEPTLVVICFSMGLWVAGNYTLSACRQMRKHGFNITAVTPGIEKEDIYSSLEKLSGKFKNLVLAGYPPYLMDVINEVKQRHITLPKKIFAITAGDKFSEQWRDAFLERIAQKNLWQVVSIYGCADAGALGYETRLSIFLRRAALKNPDLYKELFGDDSNLPALLQYDPEHIYFENLNKELIFTTATAAPLIRYNIHDLGEIHQPDAIAKLIKGHALDSRIRKARINNNLPVIVKKGRSDVAVTFYAINIYPEQINAAVIDPKVKKYLSGDYFVYNHSVKNHKKEKLHFVIELASGYKSGASLLKKISESVVRNFSALSMEYRKLRGAIGAKANPEIELVLFGQIRLSQRYQPVLFSEKGKKPKMLIS